MAKLAVSPFATGNKPSKLKTDIDVQSMKVLEDKADLPKGHGLFRILHQDYGDKRLVWDTKDFAQINEARQIFKDLIAQGFVPYLVDKKTGEPTTMPMAQFDALEGEVWMEEHEIIMAPMQAAVGG